MHQATKLINMISEIFNHVYDHTKTDKYKRPDKEVHAHEFTTDKGNKYHAVITHHKDSADVVFGTNHKGEDKSQGMTGEEGSSAHKILGTVKHIVKQHLKDHPHIKKIEFGAEESEKGRVKTYQALSKSIAHKHEEKVIDGGRYFTIHRDHIK